MPTTVGSADSYLPVPTESFSKYANCVVVVVIFRNDSERNLWDVLSAQWQTGRHQTDNYI